MPGPALSVLRNTPRKPRCPFATRLLTLSGGSLADDQIAIVMGWSVKKVSAIRRRYVDESPIVVAIAHRMAATQV